MACRACDIAVATAGPTARRSLGGSSSGSTAAVPVGTAPSCSYVKCMSPIIGQAQASCHRADAAGLLSHTQTQKLPGFAADAMRLNNFVALQRMQQLLLMQQRCLQASLAHCSLQGTADSHHCSLNHFGHHATAIPRALTQQLAPEAC